MSKTNHKLLSVGNFKLELGKNLQELEDSTDLYEQGLFQALYNKLDSEGVVLVRNIIPRDVAMLARDSLLKHIASKPGSIQENTDYKLGVIGSIKEGFTVDAESGEQPVQREAIASAVQGWKEIGNSTALKDIYNGKHLKQFYHQLFGGKFTNFPDCTWLRMKGVKELTAEHTDYYYFKNNTNIFSEFINNSSKAAAQNSECSGYCVICHQEGGDEKTLLCDLCERPFHMDCCKPAIKHIPSGEWHCFDCANQDFPYWTCWIALGDINLDDGRLCLIPKSHKIQGYEYSNIKNKLLPLQFTKSIASQSIWRAANLKAGDVILFNIKTIHAANENLTNRYRISCDTRVTSLILKTKVYCP